MRSVAADYELRVANSLSDALRFLAKEPGWKPLAGGTDLMVLYDAGKLEPRRLLGLWNLKELRGIRMSAKEVAFGALTTYSEILSHPKVPKLLPLMAEAARVTGAVAIQNRGTLGGNLANASPAADTPPVLLAYGAEVEIVSSKERRRIPYGEFHLGYKRTALRPGELLSRIFVPIPPKGTVQGYRKVGTRSAQAISKASFAGILRRKREIDHIALAFGSVAPTPLRAVETEALLRGQKPTRELLARARQCAAREIAPIDDLRSTGSYRREVALNVMGDFLADALGLD